MAIQNVPDSQKIDYLWKKLGYGAAKTDISGNIDATQEPFPSPLQIRADKMLQQSSLIPSVIPGSNSSVVTVYPTTFPVECTNDAGIPTPTLTWNSGRTFWIPPEFGSTYQIKVYIAPSGNAANVASKGTQVFATGSGNNDEWFFDYQAGILQFNGNNTPYSGGSPISFTGNSVYISGGVYSGAFGLPTASSIGNVILGNITFSNTTMSTSLSNASIILSATGTGTVQVTGNLALGIPAGGTIQRPSNPLLGFTRWNTDLQALEVWNGSTWYSPGSSLITSDIIYPDGVSNVFSMLSSGTTNGVMVNINGTMQQPILAYTVSGNLITFSETPLVTDVIEVRHIAAGATTISSLNYGNTAVTLDTANVNVISQYLVTTGNLNVGGNVTAGTFQTGVTHFPTSANVLYVAKNGNDSYDGTINAPLLTIKAAMALAANISSPAGVSVHVAPGNYTEANPVTIPPNTALMGDNLKNVFVYPQTPSADLFYMSTGTYVWGITINNYLANGFSYNSSTSSANVFVSPYIQNITSKTTTGTAVYVDGNNVSPYSTKAMIVGFFTIINQGGVGIHLSNSAYSQLVNIYTIGANVGIWSDSGSFCTLNGSDTSVGNIGLRADGYGPLLSTGQTVGYSINGQFVLNNLTAVPHVNEVVVINGDTNFYSIDTITKIDAITYQVNIQEVYAGNLAPGSNIAFYQRSQVIASAHTFEYVGAGTVLANALPQYGGLPNSSLNVIQTNGGRVTYTGTDEKGNFYIGSNLIINQGTGTITGNTFVRSMFSLMTPYILALEGL